MLETETNSHESNLERQLLEKMVKHQHLHGKDMLKKDPPIHINQ